MRGVLSLVLLVTLLGAVASAEDFQAAYQRGKDLYRRGEYARAVAALKTAYAQNPLPGVLLNLGQAQLGAGQARDAVRSCERYLREQPDGPAERRQAAQECLSEARRQLARTRRAEERPRPAGPEAAAVEPGKLAAQATDQGKPVEPAQRKPAEPAQPTDQGRPADPGKTIVVDRLPGDHAQQPTGPDGLVLAAAPARKPPIYKRWWLWTTLGIVVAGGVAVTLALTLPRDADLSDVPTDNQRIVRF